MPGLLKNGFLFLIFVVALYPIFIGLLTIPWLQRHALYAHKIHSGFYHDVNNPESFGFAKNQVTPFSLDTPDGETLYAWHILPLDVYSYYQGNIIKAGETNNPEYIRNVALEILRIDPDARVVVNFHGNAGHVAQGWRTDTYRSLTSQPHTHVFTVDYRGFGKSTGSPTEAGLITDGIALVEYLLRDVGIPQDRIVILGQSLGTAVATAVGLHFATLGDRSDLLPALPEKASGAAWTKQTVFAGIILVAPFTRLPDLLLSYRIGGLIPVLRPLRPFPRLVAWVESYILDTWPTASRLAALVNSLEDNTYISQAEESGRELGSIRIIHAVNDMDISVEQGRMLFALATPGQYYFEGMGDMSWKYAGSPKVTIDIVEHGGHNRIVTYAPVSLAVLKAFEGK